MRFFIADDHALFADGFSLLIQQLFPVSTCACVHDYKSLLLHPDVLGADLLFLDWHMPGMQGIYSIRMLQQSYPGLPICVISADESRTQLPYIMRTGVSGFIPKSVQASELKNAIDTMLCGEVYEPMYGVIERSDAILFKAEQSTHLLTNRQMQILVLLMDGNPNKMISQKLGIQESTLKTHIKSIFRTLDAKNRTEAVNKARRLGLVD